MKILSREALGQRVIGMKMRAVAALDPIRNSDFPPDFTEMAARCAPYTMTSIERLFGVHEAVRHVDANSVDGDWVECGVWRGGSSMMAALTMLQAGRPRRHMWLYDTFAGMSEPDENDPPDAHRDFEKAIRDGYNAWCYAPLDDVRANVASTGWPAGDLELVVGKVEDTIPAAIPEKISVLRLDTDWYESTRHELEHLWPRLEVGGVLIIDDYGHWTGARKAVDEYFEQAGLQPLLSRLDYTGRMCVKTR